MRSIEINSKLRTIKESSFEGGSRGSLDYLQKCVDGTIDLVRVDAGVDLYVNDEGLINGTPDFFIFKGYHQPLAGNAVLVGSNDEGETVSLPKWVTVKWVQDRVEFADINTIRFMAGAGKFD